MNDTRALAYEMGDGVFYRIVESSDMVILGEMICKGLDQGLTNQQVSNALDQGFLSELSNEFYRDASVFMISLHFNAVNKLCPQHFQSTEQFFESISQSFLVDHL